MAFSMKSSRHFHHQSSPANPDLQRQAVLHSFNSRKEERAQKLLAHANSFATLPLYKTPPSARKTERPFNPFNKDLTERLECSTFSPTVFENVISPREVSSSEFRWTIDDVSRFTPARIEETSVTHADIDLIDNETEQSAQEAIERFFSKVEIPSPWPWEAPKHCSSPLTETPEIVYKSKTTTTTSSSIMSSATNYQRKVSPSLTCNVSTQTCLSLPPILPVQLEEMLKPYLQPVTVECETGEEYLSTSTLRRKLNFSKATHGSDRCASNDEMNSDQSSVDDGFLSPVSHFRTATPLPMMSPPDVSPIVNTMKSTHSKLTTRLNFTDIHCDEDGNGNKEECNEEMMSIMMTSMKPIDNSVVGGTKDEDGIINNVNNNMSDDDCPHYRTGDVESVSHDTGYQTQSSNDKTSWGGTTAASEIMEITNSANTSWAEPL